jgi:hypothetical protein
MRAPVIASTSIESWQTFRAAMGRFLVGWMQTSSRRIVSETLGPDWHRPNLPPTFFLLTTHPAKTERDSQWRSAGGTKKADAA